MPARSSRLVDPVVLGASDATVAIGRAGYITLAKWFTCENSNATTAGVLVIGLRVAGVTYELIRRTILSRTDLLIVHNIMYYEGDALRAWNAAAGGTLNLTVAGAHLQL